MVEPWVEEQEQQDWQHETASQDVPSVHPNVEPQWGQEQQQQDWQHETASQEHPWVHPNVEPQWGQEQQQQTWPHRTVSQEAPWVHPNVKSQWAQEQTHQAWPPNTAPHADPDDIYKILCKNLRSNTSESRLWHWAENFGPVIWVQPPPPTTLSVEWATGSVMFANPVSVEWAIRDSSEGHNKSYIDGRWVCVQRFNSCYPE